MNNPKKWRLQPAAMGEGSPGGESPNEQVVRRKWVWQSESYHVVPWEVDRTAGEYGEPYIARIDLLRNAA